MLRGIFGVQEGYEWQVEKAHNEELHSLYRSHNITRVIKSRRLKWAGHIARMEEARSAFRILTGTPTGKRPLVRLRCRWKNNIRMSLKEIDINTGIGIIGTLVNATLRLRVP
jgi:hypothetical protein